jgi:hypothetical protein
MLAGREHEGRVAIGADQGAITIGEVRQEVAERLRPGVCRVRSSLVRCRMCRLTGAALSVLPRCSNRASGARGRHHAHVRPAPERARAYRAWCRASHHSTGTTWRMISVFSLRRLIISWPRSVLACYFSHVSVVLNTRTVGCIASGGKGWMRRVVWLGLALVVVGLVGAAALPRQPEPVYSVAEVRAGLSGAAKSAERTLDAGVGLR